MAKKKTKKTRKSLPELSSELQLAKAKLISKAHGTPSDLENAQKLVEKIDRYVYRGSDKKRAARISQNIKFINAEIEKLGEKQERRKHVKYANELRHDSTDGIPNRLLRMSGQMRMTKDDLDYMIKKYGTIFISNLSGDELYETFMDESNSLSQDDTGQYYYDIDEIKGADFDTYNEFDFPFI